MTKVKQIQDFTKFDNANNELVFAKNNKVYSVHSNDVDFIECFGVEVVSYDDFDRCHEGIECHVNNLSECDQYELEIIQRWAVEANACTEITKEYLEETRHSFLSEVFKTAWKKCKTKIHNFSASLKETWKETKVALANVVTFFTLPKSDEEVEITTRQVRFIDVLKDGRLRFLDLIKDTFISFHQYQLMSYETAR